MTRVGQHILMAKLNDLVHFSATRRLPKCGHWPPGSYFYLIDWPIRSNRDVLCTPFDNIRYICTAMSLTEPIISFGNADPAVRGGQSSCFFRIDATILLATIYRLGWPIFSQIGGWVDHQFGNNNQCSPR